MTEDGYIRAVTQAPLKVVALTPRSPSEYFVCEHDGEAASPTRANPTRPPCQAGLDAICGSKAGRGSAQAYACAYGGAVRDASGQQSETVQPMPAGNVPIRLAGTTG